MRLGAVLRGALLGATQASAAAVFAHFMVGNANNYTLDDWQTDIGLAAAAHIDAFALNIAYGDDTITSSLALAFEAVQGTGFSLFFSFDYAGGIGPWPEAVVIAYGNQYFGNAGYYKYNGQPFVSTFEGPDNAADWINIKAQTGCFFMPDWSSEGADRALQLAGGGVVDGLFSWAAWPWGNQDMNTYVDASYYQYMGKNLSGPDPGAGLPYMMPVSPWFFTNLPGYNKNWLWRGDDLWYDRWVQVLYNEPEFVEIISWNDYGESHYIGPSYDYAMEGIVAIGKPPSNYMANMPHDGWRKFLPFLIDTYKNGIATITEEGLVGWYRTSPGTACGTGGTVGNTVSQLQIEFQPYEIAQDKVFFSALLGSSADISVSIGGASQSGSWTDTPDGGVGIYHGSVPFNGLGDVVITLSRNGATIAQISGGPAISSSCTDGITNWNAWVGESDGPAISATPTLTRSEMTCINGTGTNNFAGICQKACEWGYCPISACQCLEIGKPVDAPKATNPVGYPISGEDPSYEGVCAYDCLRGYCPDTACGTVSVPLSTPTVSDFTPPACVKGEVLGSVSVGLTGLCSYACGFGFCPIQVCECTGQGGLADSDYLYDDTVGTPIAGLDDYGLCAWTCSHGYCPPGVCVNGTSSGGSGSGGSSGGSGIVYVDPGVWVDPDPTVGCYPPCTLLFPPLELPTPITVTWPPYETGLLSSSGAVTVTVTTIITLPPFVVSSVPFWPVTIGTSDPLSGNIAPVQSIEPPVSVITLASGEAPFSMTVITGVGGVVDGTTTTTANYTMLPPTWGGGVVSIQAHPTISIVIPGGNLPLGTFTTTSSGITVVTTTTQSTTGVYFTQSSASAKPTCTSDCGSRTCDFGCGLGCGIFGCGGGCGIFGCGGGGCGLLGCGGGYWSNNDCGPAGCGCIFGCSQGGTNGQGGSGSCEGPDCDNDDPDECSGDDCECEPTKTVTSCGVLCTETVALTTTVTGTCSTTTCATTSCGVDTTVTKTTTRTEAEEIDLTQVASDTAWTEDTTDAFATTIYDDIMSWWSYEDAYAATATDVTTPAETSTATAATSLGTSIATSTPISTSIPTETPTSIGTSTASS